MAILWLTHTHTQNTLGCAINQSHAAPLSYRVDSWALISFASVCTLLLVVFVLGCSGSLCVVGCYYV